MGHELFAKAIVFDGPKRLRLTELALARPGPGDAVVDILFSGVSAGTEKLFWTGEMPPFPGMGYPLVPGYEAMGIVAEVGAEVDDLSVGDAVFAPGAACFGEIRGLFGGAANRVVTPARRLLKLGPADGAASDPAQALYALAATARHAIDLDRAPELVVGHGALGRLVARMVVALGAPAPAVWEIAPERAEAGGAYPVLRPEDDPRKDYRAICDVSGDAAILDQLIARLAPGGEITLAGFYAEPLSFAFAPAFLREARLRVAAQWTPADLRETRALVANGALSLDGLVTHLRPAEPDAARDAYETAFGDPGCLKMILDWRQAA